MNAFEQASTVEAESWEILRPFIETRSFDGRFVRTAKGKLAKELQRSVGDVLYNSDDETVHTVEIKAERKFTTNMFFERWSNRKRFTPGWFETLKCELLLYHFLDEDALYGFNFEKLRTWFYCCEHRQIPVCSKYPQYEQRAYRQLNDTWGYLVPIKDIPRSAMVGIWHPVRMSTHDDLFGDAA